MAQRSDSPGTTQGQQRRTPLLVGLVVALLAVVLVWWFVGGRDQGPIEVDESPTGSVGEETDEAEGDDEPDADEPDVSDDTTPDDAEEDPAPVGPFSEDAVETDGFPEGGEGVVHLTDVRLAAHDGFDRFVLEFEGEPMSPFRVAYVDGPILEDGSGNEVDLDGTAFLEVRLTAASGVDFDTDAEEGYEVTYDGPQRLSGDTSVIAEALRTGDFEATLTWTLGLRERAGFAVTVLEEPLRLVIDVAS